jgi:processive 1,2-diacylglycerol beta-glucosyltransferase
MVKLFDAETSAAVGEITEGQLQFLIDNLEETSTDDRDYWIDIPTLAMLRTAGADEELVVLLAKGLGGRPGYEVRWER